MSQVEILGRWFEHQRANGARPRTIKARRVHMGTFTRWLGPVSLADVSPDDIERFLASRGPIQPKTRSTWLSHLHCFYQWAIEHGHCETDPTAHIPRPRCRRYTPRPAATAQLASAIGAADPRTRCWMFLAAYEGLRCQEIAGLRREDVIDDDALLRVVTGKGGHERVLPLHPDVLVALRALPMPRHGYLFTVEERWGGGPLRPEYLSRVFSTRLAELGVQATPHQLRHWFGSNLYVGTRDLRLVQEMLGHSSPATTAIYTAFDRERAGQAIAGLGFTPGVVSSR